MLHLRSRSLPPPDQTPTRTYILYSSSSIRRLSLLPQKYMTSGGGGGGCVHREEQKRSAQPSMFDTCCTSQPRTIEVNNAVCANPVKTRHRKTATIRTFYTCVPLLSLCRRRGPWECHLRIYDPLPVVTILYYNFSALQ